MKKSLLFVLILFTLNNLLAQTDSVTLKDANDIIREYDTIPEYLPLELYKYGGDQRYTITGDAPRLLTRIKPVTASVIGGVTLASMVVLHINQKNAWWQNQRGGFHFAEDWVSALQVDKCGHSFGGYLMAYGMDEALKASGVDYRSSAIWGSALAVAYQSYVEIEDGFAGEWGFSPSDFYFDFLGPTFYLAQQYVPALQNITPKWQYVPSEWTGKPIINRPRTFIDDYNSSTFWYSINIYNILPKEMKQFWVPWINIAIGYGADAIDVKLDPNGSPDQLSRRRYAISLDYNLVKILPDGGSFWNWFRQSLNYIKFPSPAVEFSPSGTRFYILYPFQINLGGLKL